MKICDQLLEVLGNAYRWACGVNDVLITHEGDIITFEDFVKKYLKLRETRTEQHGAYAQAQRIRSRSPC